VNHLNIAKNVLKLEAQCLLAAADKITQEQTDLLNNVFIFLKSSGGSLVFSGIGKSGLIAQKLSSTFSSLGLPSFFLHPVEALHGDLGRLSKSDAFVLLSKSGNTEELMKLISFLPIEKSNIIGLLGNLGSGAKLKEKCGVVFDCTVEKEACINNLAPTTSTTLALAMGDAMAVLYESIVGLSKEGFAVNHPAGMLGKTLLIKVRDIYCKKETCPVVTPDTSLQDVILAMTEKNVGGCAIVDSEDVLLGIMVEGDIRRFFSTGKNDLQVAVKSIMTESPVFIAPDQLAYEALSLMERRENQITVLPVVSDKKFLGFLRLHDLLREGFSLK